MNDAERGHRLIPGTDGTTVEAWAPSRESCLAEVVTGFVDGFAECGDVASTTTVPVFFAVDADEDLLVAVLEEVIYLLDMLGSVVVTASLSATEDGGVAGFFEVAELAEVIEFGPTPKGISRRGLALRSDTGGWVASATVDV